jgi:peptidoglycan/LPS O-acetylase OafA/YrhL
VLTEVGEEADILHKTKISEIDLVRAFAILGVLIIHATASSTIELPARSITQAIYLFINKWSDFSIPAFVMISGLVLFYRYFDSWNPKMTLSFYRKRIQFVFIPYLIWSLFYCGSNLMINPYFRDGMTFMHFFHNLLWGEMSYHLYFMVLILQFYVIFPFLLYFKRFGHFKLGLLTAGLFLQAGMYACHYYFGPFTHRSAICFTYFTSFCLGGVIGTQYDSIKELINRYLKRLLVLVIFLGFLLSVIYELRQFNFDLGRTIAEITVHLYSLVFTVCLIGIANRIINKNTRINSIFISLGSASFGIYLIHPFFLTLWQHFILVSVSSPLYQPALVAGFLLILVLPWLIVILLKKSKASRILIGK